MESRGRKMVNLVLSRITKTDKLPEPCIQTPDADGQIDLSLTNIVANDLPKQSSEMISLDVVEPCIQTPDEDVPIDLSVTNIVTANDVHEQSCEMISLDDVEPCIQIPDADGQIDLSVTNILANDVHKQSCEIISLDAVEPCIQTPYEDVPIDLSVTNKVTANDVHQQSCEMISLDDVEPCIQTPDADGQIDLSVTNTVTANDVHEQSCEMISLDDVEPCIQTPGEDVPIDLSVTNTVSNNVQEESCAMISLDVLETKRPRNKKATPNLWKRNISKNKRATGEEYINRSGKIIPKKVPLKMDCSKCRFKCNNNFNYETQIKINQEYWRLGDAIRQKQYIASLIIRAPVARRRLDAKNQKIVSKQYHLKAIGGDLIRVCIKFFCATFSISHRVVDDIDKSISDTGLYNDCDGRIGTKPYNITPDNTISKVKDHINSFPRMESHYCRKDSSKLYLAPDLNISKMHRLYLEQQDATPVSFFIYKKIFQSYEPQLSFYVPKKDQCVKCNIYNLAVDKTAFEDDWQQHKMRERDSMKMKEDDKNRSTADPSFKAITFDLQSILTMPYAGDSEIYYKRKLNAYNFTIFEYPSKNGFCYMWDECNGQKGSNEIGTCILKYLSSLPMTVNHVASFSDTCGGQNRNKHVAAAMLYAINKLDNLHIIDLKFMESGHSYLEADAMHSTIERARKHKKIYTTREWALLISTARINPKPYNVEVLHHKNFFDLKNLTNAAVHNTTKNTKGDNVSWLLIKWLRFSKEKPHKILYKYNLIDDEFFEIDVNQKRNAQVTNWNAIELKEAYPCLLPISENKKKDLDSLIGSGVIPGDYKYFYDSLPSTSKRMRADDEDIL